MPYDDWAQMYNESVEDLAMKTWLSGIAAELTAIGRHEGAVLDLGAGTGIGSRVLKSFGHFNVTSLDRSEKMLEQAKLLTDSTVLADITSFDLLPRTFDLIVSGFDTLNYLSFDALVQCFRLANMHLRGDGLMIFDYSSPRLLREEWADLSYEQELTAGRLAWAHRFDRESGFSRTSITLLNNEGVVWQEAHIQYAFDTYDMHRAAALAGLNIERIRNLANQTFSPKEKTHLYVLTK
jgi:SAM-dependent methyltransferase